MRNFTLKHSTIHRNLFYMLSIPQMLFEALTVRYKSLNSIKNKNELILFDFIQNCYNKWFCKQCTDLLFIKKKSTIT